MNGNQSGLIIGLEPIPMTCLSCQNNKSPHADVCSHNYEGLSKGIEATGAARLVKWLFAEGIV
jgi:hypothetical protein